MQPINKATALTNEPKLCDIVCATVSTSFVTLDNKSPFECVSKYLSGNLFILVDILVLSFFAKLLATLAIIKPSKKLNKALIKYITSKNITIFLIALIFILGLIKLDILLGNLSNLEYISFADDLLVTPFISFRNVTLSL